MMKIRKAEDNFLAIFVKERPFNEHLVKNVDEVIFDMYDHNQFKPIGEVTLKDLEGAITYQKETKAGYFKYDSREPLNETICEQLELEGGPTMTMLVSKEASANWKVNEQAIIKDLHDEDFFNELLQLELDNYGEAYGVDFCQRKMKEYGRQVKLRDDFHYYGIFLEDTLCGACYAFASEGYVCVDSLIVSEKYRKQYLATTLLKYINEHFKEELFLHADPDDTPIEMYRKMGFKEVDVLYEYTKVFD